MEEFGENPFNVGTAEVAQALDNDASPTSADGRGVSLSLSQPGGPSISGEFSIRANHTGTNQGTCLFSVGAVAG